MPSQNFCNPDHCSNSCVLSLHVVHQGGGLAHQGEGLVHQGQGLLHHGEGQQDPTGTLRRLPHPRHDRSILRHHSKDKTSAHWALVLSLGSKKPTYKKFKKYIAVPGCILLPENKYVRNEHLGTWGARIKILRPLFNTNTPPKTPI